MIFQLFDWFPEPMIWAIINKFDQIRKNWWRISCAEILEVGKKFFAASSVKKMSRFEEVSPEESKRIVDNATPINTKRSTKYGLKIFIGKFVHRRPRRCLWFTYVTALRYVLSHLKRLYENGSKIALIFTCSKGFKWKKLTLVCACVSLKSSWQLSRSKAILTI